MKKSMSLKGFFELENASPKVEKPKKDYSSLYEYAFVATLLGTSTAISLGICYLTSTSFFHLIYLIPVSLIILVFLFAVIFVFPNMCR